MNYRHEFHAGNFADCMKHAVFAWLLRAMARKAAGFFVLDTHAGAGRYDLGGPEAGRTGEWMSGIGRLLDDPPEALADYVAVVRQCGLYPGSPAIALEMLRTQDRLACCELHPEAYAALRRALAGRPGAAAHQRDGWEALRGLLPPPERRGLILIDPPYEHPDEHARLATALHAAHARFASGVYAAWYPIKDRAPSRALHDRLRASGMRDIVAAELHLRPPLDPARLNGCGLILVNPPWQFAEEIAPILQALCDRLAEPDAGEATVHRLADE
jgi:23S rRNA (adenine2030-N6)-methyltransferase